MVSTGIKREGRRWNRRERKRREGYGGTGIQLKEQFKQRYKNIRLREGKGKGKGRERKSDESLIQEYFINSRHKEKINDNGSGKSKFKKRQGNIEERKKRK